MEHKNNDIKNAVIYIHGKGGSPAEAEHYRQLFDGYDIFGFDYSSDTPWKAADEFGSYFDTINNDHDEIIIIANSIGAHFALHSLNDKNIKEAFFISPVVDMEKLISDMMSWAGVTEDELREKGEIKTAFGETLSWKYLCWVRNTPVKWDIPTTVLYGEKDELQSFTSIKSFAEKTRSEIIVMKNGEHWFHTEEQMQFLKDNIKEKMKY